jgi:hypothetical protein
MARLNPDGVESVLALVQATNAESLAAAWDKAHAAWQKLTPDGTRGGSPVVLASISTPAGLATSPERMKINASKLASIDFKQALAAFDGALAANEFTPAQFADTRGLIEALAEASAGHLDVVEWRRNLPETSAWWFLIDGFLSRDHPIGIARLKPAQAVQSAEQAASLRRALAVPGVEVGLSGWAFTLAELGHWSERKMASLSALMVLVNIFILGLLLRSARQIGILIAGLALSVGALLATIKCAGITLNLFNVLAFPLVLGVGVDYGIYVALAMRSADPQRELTALMKPVLLSGLTTVVGFGSLAWAQNPALRGLGLLCGIGVGWCMVATFVFVLPACAIAGRRQ